MSFDLPYTRETWQFSSNGMRDRPPTLAVDLASPIRVSTFQTEAVLAGVSISLKVGGPK